MKIRLPIYLILIFANFTFANDELNPYEEELEWLETSDVIQDVRKAIEQNDFRIKCVMGFALRCPGVKNREGLLYSVIEETGDVVTSDRHEKLLIMATKYALSYNEYLIKIKRLERDK